MSDSEKWVPCPRPEIADVLQWREPLWAPPNKPRGKPDKIGEQQVTAELIVAADSLELKVLSVEKISGGDAPLKVKAGDVIRRKRTSLAQGNCLKQIA